MRLGGGVVTFSKPTIWGIGSIHYGGSPGQDDTTPRGNILSRAHGRLIATYGPFAVE
jgi:hypothetical protein